MLDQEISVRVLLKWVGIVVGILIILGLVFAVPYSMGYAKGKAAGLKAANEARAPAKNTSGNAVTDVPDDSDNADDPADSIDDTTNDSSDDAADDASDDSSDDADLADDSTDPVVIGDDDPSEYQNDENIKSFNSIVYKIDKIIYDVRGDDWGSVSKLHISVTNNENFIARPGTLKVKIYDKGGDIPEWWDDTVDVSAIGNILPKKTKTAVVDVHFSYTDKNKEKIVESKIYNVNGLLMESAKIFKVLD